MRFCNSSMAKLCALAPSEPVPPCFLIDRGSHGHFFERAAELRTGQFERPANFDLFARTVVSATKGCGHQERRLTRFTFAYKGECNFVCLQFGFDEGKAAIFACVP